MNNKEIKISELGKVERFNIGRPGWEPLDIGVFTSDFGITRKSWNSREAAADGVEVYYDPYLELWREADEPFKKRFFEYIRGLACEKLQKSTN